MPWRGAPVPRAPGARRGRSWSRLLAVVLLVHLARFLAPDSPWSRALVRPVHVICTVEYNLLLLAPGLCWLSIALWSHVDLPLKDAAAGRRIRMLLETSLWMSLALVVICGFIEHRPLALLYLPPACLWLLWRCNCCVGLKRLSNTWIVFLPLILEYKFFAWWLNYARLDAPYTPLHEKYAPRVLELLVKQGGIFVKIGQMLSLLPQGVLPEAYLRCFKSLQTRVPPRPMAEVRRLIEDGLQRPLEQVFSGIDEAPVGSASIGQVHRGRLTDGREVVVKVQYPDVSQTVEADFRNAERIVWLLDKTKVDEVREAKKHYVDELDFSKEAENLKRVRAGLGDDFPDVRVPEPIMEFCRPTVLVMTYLKGHSLLDTIMDMAEAIAHVRGKSVDQLIAELMPKKEADAQDSGKLARAEQRPSCWRRMASLPSFPDTTKLRLLQLCMSTSRSARNLGILLYNSSAQLLGGNKLSYSRSLSCFDPRELSRKLWLIHGRQVLIEGLFSTDPHPGNILVTTGGIGLIDFGQVCELTPEGRRHFAHLLRALASGSDEQEVARWYGKLGMRSKHGSHELLALNARVKFGHASILSKETHRRYQTLARQDSLSCSNSCIHQIERLVQILRGTSFLLGVPCAHGPTTLWAPIANELLGSSLP